MAAESEAAQHATGTLGEPGSTFDANGKQLDEASRPIGGWQLEFGASVEGIAGDENPANAVVPFVDEWAVSTSQPSESTDLPPMAEQRPMPGADASAPPGANNYVETTHELSAANVAVGRAEVQADEAVVDSGGPGASAWLADFKLDSAWRDAMGLKMLQGGEVYSEEETALIAKGLALFDSLAAGTGKVRLSTHSKTVKSAWTKHDNKSGLLVGHVETTIRASPEQIITYQMHYDRKIKLSARPNR